MDWNLFWTAFGAIGSTLCAMATTAAVFVALWQTCFSQQKKLKLSFSDKNYIVPITNAKKSKPVDLRFVSVDITNIGNRNVVVNSCSFTLNKTKFFLNSWNPMIDSDYKILGDDFQPHLPKKLAPEENIRISFPLPRFIIGISEHCEKHFLIKYFRINIIVTDSTGRIYRTKTPKTANYYNTYYNNNRNKNTEPN